MVIDDDRLSAQSNNLTLVRLILASAVIWTHSIWRTSGGSEADQFSPWLGQPISSFAVDGFFFLSGFLVYSSLLRQPSVKTFMLARLARLWPALFVAVLVVVVAGAALTTTPGLDYFRGPTAKYVFNNLSLLTPAYHLTGVNCGADPCNINGSLWTIPWEMRCYLILAMLALVGLAQVKAMRQLVLPATALVTVGIHMPGMTAVLESSLGSTIVYYAVMFDRLWFMFALGIAAFIWRLEIKLSWRWTAALLAALIAATNWGVEIPHLAHLLTASFVLNLGFLTARGRAVSGSWPDYSYGMYIYAFPVMMLLAAAVPSITSGALAGLTALATLVPAALSWHFIEKPVLDFVRSRRQKLAQAPAAAPISANSPNLGV